LLFTWATIRSAEELTREAALHVFVAAMRRTSSTDRTPTRGERPSLVLHGDGNPKYRPVIAAGHVNVSSDANVYAVNVTLRAQAWNAAVGGWLAIGEHRLVVTNASQLTAFALTVP
jgi:hypothetical protein